MATLPAYADAATPPDFLALQAKAGNLAVATLFATTAGPRAITIQRDASFDQAVGEPIEQIGAPDQLGLPAELQAGIQQAWDNSFDEEGAAIEQGGIIVLTADGEYQWRPGAHGTSGGFRPNYGDVRPGETLIASGHTHPYGTTDLHQWTDVTFSGADIGNLVTQKERVKIVQSGDARFVVSKTGEFDQMVETASAREGGLDELREEIVTFYDGLYREARSNGDQLPAACRYAAMETCDRYNLVFYEGSGAKVDRPPEVHIETDAEAESAARREAVHA